MVVLGRCQVRRGLVGDGGVVGQEHPVTVALLAGLTWASEEHTKLSEIVQRIWTCRN